MNSEDYWNTLKKSVEEMGTAFRSFAATLNATQESVAWAMRATVPITPEKLLGIDLTPYDEKEANGFQVRFGAYQVEFCNSYYKPTNSLCTREKGHTGIHAAENHRDELVASWYSSHG